MIELTEKQLEALKAINLRDGKPIDLDTVLSNLSYRPTKQAFQFTLRSLIKKKLVRKIGRLCIGGRSHRILAITEIGAEVLNEYIAEEKRLSLI